MAGRHTKCMQTLTGRSKGKTPLGRPERRWEDNIGMVLREIGWGGVNWICLV
jgi:hypothetical protein